MKIDTNNDKIACWHHGWFRLRVRVRIWMVECEHGILTGLTDRELPWMRHVMNCLCHYTGCFAKLVSDVFGD